MQHNFYHNRLWFIFANISTECPVCVQYLARSAFVISSLRPAYARVYPAGRQDLAAEIFFHTKIGSNLLKSITEDDLITWFGQNRTIADFKKNEKCDREITKITTTDNPVVSPKFEVLSVATYTINVDNESISNINNTKNEETSEDNEIKHEENILKKKSRSVTVALTQITTESTKIFVSESKSDSDSNSTIPEITTKQPLKDLIVDRNVSPPKHINTVLNNTPLKYLEKDLQKSSVTFPPEIKNDQYVLLDKEDLWGMLKEVVDDVDDQLKKKSKIGEKLRSQGFT